MQRNKLKLIMDVIKKQILESFLENVCIISDEKYQQRIWVRAEGPEFGDIDDVVCDFFDNGESILEKYKEFGINENQYNLLIELKNKLRDFTDTFGVYSPVKSTEKLIQLPRWGEIRDLARKVIIAFNYQKKRI